ncbi:MAG: NYN domain-containing protein [Planctomycetes bacterium]|nr:NYN domain-containing protein [Planctomycetota bacterium]
MPLVVDCYNVLHQTMPASMAGLDEDGLCRALARSLWAGQTITVVCDGAPKPHLARESPVAGVELVYAGKSRSADAWIMEMIQRESAPRRLTVATSDREIQKAAKRRGAKVIPAEELIRTLSIQGPKGGGRGGKPSGPLSEDEVARWMREFGVDEGKKG